MFRPDYRGSTSRGRKSRIVDYRERMLYWKLL